MLFFTRTNNAYKASWSLSHKKYFPNSTKVDIKYWGDPQSQFVSNLQTPEILLLDS